MLPRHTIEAYLFFLLRHKGKITLLIGAITAFFLYFMWFHMAVATNFFDLYPPGHPYIQLYTKYRSMFGTANQLVIVVETKEGTIFDSPETFKKVDRITIDLLQNVPGVNGEQVLSITHPKTKTTLTSGTGIKVVPLTYPRLPEDEADLEFMKTKVYTTDGIRGFFVSMDDKATLITAGFWEEYFDLPAMLKQIEEIVERETDSNHTIYVTGPPVLYAYFMSMVQPMMWVLIASITTMIVILWFEFRSWQGVVIPLLSGGLSAIWGLGFGGLFGLSLDPLVLVIPLLISARAHSHSVQSMERYHEEYEKLQDKDAAIVKSYTEIYAPAMVSIVADGIAILTLIVARIPIIQKLAVLCSFWIISIFVSVVTLHPIILSYVKPPKHLATHHGQKGIFARGYDKFEAFLIYCSTGPRRGWMAVFLVFLLAFGFFFAQKVRPGDTSPGKALLYDDHPYNVAFDVVNDRFVGASQLIVIAEGKKSGALKDPATLNSLDLFARYMKQTDETGAVGGTISATTMLKRIFRTFHEGDPKWETLPVSQDHVGQLFFLLTSNTSRGEMDRFFDMSMTNATLTIFYKDYNHEIIKNSIAKAKEFIEGQASEEGSVRYLLAGGLLGILAATNEEVEWSYRVNLALILIVVFILSYLTYVSVIGAFIVMLPSLISQPLSEACMYFLGIDFNINSLPVAAVGIGIGIDYGYYVLSRIVEEYPKDRSFDNAIVRAYNTTGKTVLFTGLSLTASIVYWCFFPMKFQAQMAILLVILLAFHLIGALLFIPPMVSLLRPKFAIKYADDHDRRILEEGIEGDETPADA
ncbi:MAG: MMPL family transporter [Candidatus Binatia bacterium]|nr:MMPL family transporter [Candidatus Binatia bacterium]